MEGMKPPLYRQGGSLFQWMRVFCIREVDRCCHSSWHRGYLSFSLPPLLCLALPTVTQFHEWLHSSWGSLSACINGHWHHSLHLMYVFLPRSAATSHYLRSSPILSGCCGRCPWWKSQLPIFPPQGSFTGRSSGDQLTIVLLWHLLSFTSCRGRLAWVRLVHLSHAWQLPIHKGTPISDVMRSQFWWRTHDLPCWFITL